MRGGRLDVDDVLEKLQNSPMVRAWKLRMSCRLLLEAEIDSLLDQCVIDWNNFYLSHLELIAQRTGQTGHPKQIT